MIKISNNQINVNFSTEGLTDEQMRDKVQSIQHRMKTVVDEVRALYDNYEVYYSWNDVHDKKTFLGEKENQVCRFCGVKKGEIAAGESKPCSFKKEAHALSNLIGNNHLFSYYECDKCNGELFTKMESHFANFMKLYHCVLKVKGKRGYPSYKNKPDDFSRIDSGNNFKIQQKEDEEPIVEIHEDTNTLIIKGKRTYIPQMVYKCLLKMALTIMPESDIVHFNYALAFLQGKVQYDKNMIVLLSMYREAFPHISCTIYKKKKLSSADVPSYLFCLYYQNVAFQMYLPFCDTDKCLDGKTITIPFVPTPFDIENGPFCQCKLDLSSEEKKEKERCEITLTYERAEVTESANPMVSIIVPVYKVPEQYLRQCIESCMNQTMREIEIILVDDGSPDDCGKICDEYAERDARVRVIHKENGGLVSARNAGFDAIQGEWHMYIDGDDWIDLDTCESIFKVLNKYENVDVVFWKFLQDRNGKSEKSLMEWKCNDKERLYVGKECHDLAKHTMIYSSGITTAYAKLINTKWAKEQSIKHDNRLRQGEEGVEFSLRLFYYANKVLFLNSYWNHYRYVESGISKSVNEKNAEWITDCFIIMNEDIEKFENKDEVRTLFFQRVIYGIISFAMNIYFSPNNEEQLSLRIKKFKSIISNDLYKEAIKKCPLDYMDKFRIITLYVLKLRLYFLLELIGRTKYYMLNKGRFTY